MHPNSGEPVVMEGRSGGTHPAAATTPLTIFVKNKRGRESFARSGVFRNLDGTNTLRVSFDDGQTYTTIPANGREEFTRVFNKITVKSSASTVNWEATLAVA